MTKKLNTKGDRSALYGQDVSESNGNGESQCVDPTVDDPESFECDCIESWIASCDGVDADCFHTKMCEHSKICSSWKDSHCPTPVALMSRRAEVKNASVVDSLLDNSLSGKCSQ